MIWLPVNNFLLLLCLCHYVTEIFLFACWMVVVLGLMVCCLVNTLQLVHVEFEVELAPQMVAVDGFAAY